MEGIRKEKTRYNIHDEFEQVYLTEKWLKRLIAKSDPDILNNKDFRNTVIFMSKKHWRMPGRSFLFKSNGFDSQDIYNMTLLFGYAFFGSEFRGKTIRDDMNVMMKFIDQRFAKVVDAIYRKFQVNEVVRSNHDLMESDCEDLFVEEDYSEIEMESDLAFYEEDLESEDSDEEESTPFDHYNANELEFAGEAKIQKDKIYIQEKMAIIANDPAKYSSELSWYATSKHVSGDVRKIAKKICDKYEINYRHWTQQKIDQGIGQNEFDLYEKAQ